MNCNDLEDVAFSLLEKYYLNYHPYLHICEVFNIVINRTNYINTK